MSDWNDQFYEMMGRLRQNQTKSKAAAVIKAPCDMIVSDNPGRDKSSKAASPSAVFSSDEELIASAPPGPVPDRIRQRIVQTAEGPAKVTSYEYERQGSSSSTDMVYKCGTHDYETKNLKEFNNHIAKTHNDSSTSSNSSSKAASIGSANKARVIAEFLNSQHY